MALRRAPASCGKQGGTAGVAPVPDRDGLSCVPCPSRQSSRGRPEVSQLFRPVDPSVSFPELETGILEFWREHDIFRRSIEERPEDNLFVFYEGPPTANGRPGVHHIMPRVIKDLFARYQDDAGLPRAPQGGLGYARPASRDRGGEGAGAELEARDRGVRHRPLQREVPGEREPPRGRLRGADGGGSPSGRTWRTRTSPTTTTTSRAGGGSSSSSGTTGWSTKTTGARPTAPAARRA